MKSWARIRPAWPNWLVWALPAGIGLAVIGYQCLYQVAVDSTRSLSIFWGEILVFGIIGPLVAWLLLRQLALDATEIRAAARRGSSSWQPKRDGAPKTQLPCMPFRLQ